MIKLKYIFVFLFISSTNCFSQTTFSNLDSLLTKNFESVNRKDSIYYLSLINQHAIFKDKKERTKADFLIILTPFFKAFSELIATLTDMTGNSDFTIRYLDYECKNKVIINTNGKIPLHVNAVVNNSFTLKFPFVVYVNNGLYSIKDPMMVMFVESK